MKPFSSSVFISFILSTVFTFSLSAHTLQSVKSSDGKWIFTTKTEAGKNYENLYVQRPDSSEELSLILENPAKLPGLFSNLLFLPETESLYFSIHNGSEFVNGIQLFRGEGIYVVKKDMDGKYSAKGLRRYVKLEPWLLQRAKTAYFDNLPSPDYREFLNFLFGFADFDANPCLIYTNEKGQRLLNEEALEYMYETSILDELAAKENEHYHSIFADLLFCLDDKGQPTDKKAVTANHSLSFYREGSSYANYHFFSSYRGRIFMLDNRGSMKGNEWSLDFSKVYMINDSKDDFSVTQPYTFSDIKAEVFETPFPRRLDSAPLFIQGGKLYLRDINHSDFYQLQKDFSFRKVQVIEKGFSGKILLIVSISGLFLLASVLFLAWKIKIHTKNEEDQQVLIKELSEKIAQIQGKNLLIVDSHKIFLDGLKNYLKLNSSWKVAEIFNSSVDCLSYLSGISDKEKLPQIIIAGSSLQDLSGFELVREICQKWPEIKCLIYSQDDNSGSLLQSTESGARGFISKKAGESELLEALEVISRDKIYIEKALKKISEKLDSTVSVFSKQEKTIFEKILQGKTNKEIAGELFISVHSVENYVSLIYDKTFVKNRKELIQQFSAN